VACERKAAVHSWLAAAPSGRRPEIAGDRSLGATVHYFATRFEQGEGGGRHGAHQRLIDGGGAAKMTCGDGGGRDHGRSSGGWLRPRLRAFGGGDGVLGVL
jgi:hypothetical protein